MELIADILKMTLPAGLVLLAMYLSISTLVNKLMEKFKMELVLDNKKTITPIRLQAYERLTLFLERIDPKNLVIRSNDPNFNVKMFRSQLIATVREEYQHNLSQQIYVSHQSWNLIENAVEDVIGLINAAAQSIDDHEQPGQQLGLLILKVVEEKPIDNITNALSYMKTEIQQIF